MNILENKESNERYLNTIIERINEETESYYNHERSCSDSPTAEYVGSFGYGEMHDLRARLIEIDDDDLLNWLEHHSYLSDRELINILEPYCSTRSCGIYKVENALMQESMGELEYQLSDQLFDEYTALSDSDKKAVRDRVDCYMNDDYCYINASYDCWALVLDVETFNQDQEDGESSK